MHSLVFALLLSSATGQAGPPGDVPRADAPADAPAVAPAPAEPAAAPAVAPAPVETEVTDTASSAPPPGYEEQKLVWDRRAHIARRGPNGQPLSTEEFYRTIDRPDLSELAVGRSHRRIGLGVASGISLVLGAALGVSFLTQVPNPDGDACYRFTTDAGGTKTFDIATYNSCVDRAGKLKLAGIGTLMAGVVLAVVFGSLAYFSNALVIDDDEASRLVGDHDDALLERLKKGAFLSPTGGGAVAGLSLRF